MSEGFKFRIDHLVVGVLGGLVGGGVVWAATPKPTVEASADTAAATAASPDVQTEAETDVAPAAGSAAPPRVRIQQLESQMRDMRQRMTEQAKVDAVEDPDGEGRVTLSASDPKFKHAVRTLIDQAKHDAESEEQERREDWNERRIERQVDELATSLELSDEQADEVETILFDQSDQFQKMFRGDERPVTRKEWRDSMEKMRKATRDKLAKILDASQLEKWDEEQANQWGGGFGRGRGGRR